MGGKFRLQGKIFVLPMATIVKLSLLQQCQLRIRSRLRLRVDQSESKNLQQMALHHVTDLTHSVNETTASIQSPDLILFYDNTSNAILVESDTESRLNQLAEYGQIFVHEKRQPVIHQ